MLGKPQQPRNVLSTLRYYSANLREVRFSFAKPRPLSIALHEFGNGVASGCQLKTSTLAYRD